MNFKKKALGLVAAAALSLSLASGAVAQTTVSEDVTAKLRGTNCTFTLDASGSLGVWDYNGTGYDRRSGTTDTVILTGELTAGSPAGCEVSLAFEGLKDGGGGLKVDNSFFVAELGGYTINSVPTAWGPADLGSTGPVSGSLTLEDVPDDLMPGDYTGSIEVTFTTNTQ